MQGPQTLARRFELVEAAGSGGMGTVYRALDRQTGATVAAKLLEADDQLDVERFAREADVLGALSHPGIVRYIAHGVDREHRYLVMEWIHGIDLATKLAHEGLTIREAVAIASQVAAALVEAHRHDVIHRDVKPENIMLVDGDVDRARVVDFGLARYVGDDHRLTGTGIAMGTPGYMSPEQARGSRSLDGRADVFGLGCVLYEALAGVRPFSGENVMAVQLKVLMLDPAPLHALDPEVPIALSALVQRMLAKALDDRPAMPDIAAALGALDELPDGVRRTPRASHEPTRRIGANAREPAPWLVLASPRKPDDAWPRRARGAAAAWAFELTRDGVLVVRHPSAAAAARCALALADTLRDATLVISMPASDLAATIDRSTQVMSVAALRSIFARGASAGLVYLDARTAATLGDAWTIEPHDDTFVLRGER